MKANIKIHVKRVDLQSRCAWELRGYARVLLKVQIRIETFIRHFFSLCSRICNYRRVCARVFMQVCMDS